LERVTEILRLVTLSCFDACMSALPHLSEAVDKILHHRGKRKNPMLGAFQSDGGEKQGSNNAQLASDG
jgi:hypothetical protein